MAKCQRCNKKEGKKTASGKIVCDDCKEIDDVLCSCCGMKIAVNGYKFCDECDGNDRKYNEEID